jgi:hypothetical protein
MKIEGEPMKPWAVWRLDGPDGRQIECIAQADTREELETKYQRRLDSYYGIYHNRQLVKP